MKNQKKRIPDKELLEMFPEAKTIIPEKIKDWEEIIRREKEHIKNCLLFIYQQKTNEFSTWFFEEMTKVFLMPLIIEANSHVLRLKRMQSINSPSGERFEHWQEKVELAREYPIKTIAESELDLTRAGKQYKTCCPFHTDKTPSFFIYPDSNSFYCFGCCESGDTLKLTMHLYGIDFKEAVKMLSN